MGKALRIRNVARKGKVTIAQTAQSGQGMVKATPNWAGYIRESNTRGAFTEVKAQWVVPSVPPTATKALTNVLIWVGIDGFNSTSGTLIQIGTGADYKTSNGSARYFGWYEVLPTIPRIEIIPMANHPVRPGDLMAAEILQLTGTSMYMVLENYTRNWRFALPIDYNGPRQSADFIVERGFIPPNTLFPLAKFGRVTLRNCIINKNYASFNPSEKIFMVDPSANNKLLAAPSNPMPPNASTFTVSDPSDAPMKRSHIVKMISKRIGNSTLSVPAHMRKK